MNGEFLCKDCNYPIDICRCSGNNAILQPVPAIGGLGEPKPDANSRQVGGEHYRKVAGAPQHWDFVLAHGIPYMEAQIMKYVMRWRDKGGIQDLEKAKHFLEKLIEHNSK